LRKVFFVCKQRSKKLLDALTYGVPHRLVYAVGKVWVTFFRFFVYKKNSFILMFCLL